jgi:MFS family permease
VATGVLAISQSLTAAFAVGVLLGAGWALFFSSMPIVVATFVSGASRTNAFLVLSGCNALGMGVTPVLGREMVGGGSSYRPVFLAALGLSLLAAVLFGSQLRTRARPDPGGTGDRPPLIDTFRRVLSSDARRYLVMVLLGACVFTALTTYQTMFATSRGMNPAYFYLSYTVGVIGPRFTVGQRLSRLNPARTTTVLLAGLSAALALFLAVGHSTVLYAVCSLLTGVCYGLAYPLIQAQAASHSSEDLRYWVLWYFSLAYFIGVYGFPVIAGSIIVATSYSGLTAVLLVIALGEFAVSAMPARHHPAESAQLSHNRGEPQCPPLPTHSSPCLTSHPCPLKGWPSSTGCPSTRTPADGSAIAGSRSTG